MTGTQQVTNGHCCTTSVLKKLSPTIVCKRVYSLSPGFINIIDKNLFKEFLRELASLFDIQTALLKLFSASTLLPDFSSAFYFPVKKQLHEAFNQLRFCLD